MAIYQVSENRGDPTIGLVWVALPFQFFVGGAILGVSLEVALLPALGELYDGILSLLSGPFVATFCMIFTFVIGLPLRLVPILRRWWARSGWIWATTCAVIGVTGIFLAYLPMWVTHEYISSDSAGIPGGTITYPQPAIYYLSILLASLGLCHLPLLIPTHLKLLRNR